MSYERVATGELAAVVTFLEMRNNPALDVPRTSLRTRRTEQLSVERYRELFRLVGAPWLWFSRLVMDDCKLSSIIHDPCVEVFTIEDEHGRDAGFMELDFREKDECEIAFIGLTVELSGKGLGKWLLADAVGRSWREGVARVHVHTCSLDHPAALRAYRRAGFVAFKRAVERFPDPRLLGILPRDCAPHIPLIGS